MKRSGILVIVAVLTVTLTQAATAQQAQGGGERLRRDNPTAVNPAPSPATFTVVSVDTYGRNLTLQATDGSRRTVLVPEGVYPLSQLSPGDQVRVDFIVPDAMNSQPAAAAIWPVGK
jgi:hypothetical protein